MIVRKLNHRGREVWRYPAELIREERSAIVIKAEFNRDDMDLGYTTFARGDLFFEYYYTDRWYNIHTVYAKNGGGLRGWYCNIGRPATWDHDAISYEDLELDVWIPPAGDPLVLDQEEFAALDLAEEEHNLALNALKEILDRARSGTLPHPNRQS